MVEPQYVLAVIITGLGAIAFHMIRNWAKTWETRMAAQDRRMDKHEEWHGEHHTNHAVLKNDLEHIKKTSDQTAADVKELLQRDARASGS